MHFLSFFPYTVSQKHCLHLQHDQSIGQECETKIFFYTFSSASPRHPSIHLLLNARATLESCKYTQLRWSRWHHQTTKSLKSVCQKGTNKSTSSYPGKLLNSSKIWLITISRWNIPHWQHLPEKAVYPGFSGRRSSRVSFSAHLWRVGPITISKVCISEPILDDSAWMTTENRFIRPNDKLSFFVTEIHFTITHSKFDYGWRSVTERTEMLPPDQNSCLLLSQDNVLCYRLRTANNSQ